MSEPRKHHLKCLPKYFQLAWDKKKPTEIRNNDRHFKKGDIVVLHEWTPEKTSYKVFSQTTFPARYTGRHISNNVLEVFENLPGLADGYAFLIFEQVLFQSNDPGMEDDPSTTPHAGLPKGDSDE